MLAYLKREKVLTISLILAAVSAFFVPPDREYLDYIDLRVLGLLFCLMLLVRGFQRAGLFDLMTERLFGSLQGSRRLCLTLVLLCFFTSMVITNDVALITFVPFAILALERCGRGELTIPVAALQTVAANLGSMATPIGNPQNLYLFSAYDMGMGAFLRTVLPPAALSLVLLTVAALLLPAGPAHMQAGSSAPRLPRRDILVYTALFALDLLVVFRVLHWLPALIITVAGVVLLGKGQLLGRVDYALLLTFVGFFIFVGNLGRIGPVRQLVSGLLQGREILVSALFSQALSNVPAAILLSGFTDNGAGLLLGVNVGGLGTLIASMASLISYKLYAAQPGAKVGKYFLTFTAYNLVFLAILLCFCLLVY